MFDDIDEKVKDIIGTQMTGFASEFDGDCSKQTEDYLNNSDSEQLADDNKECGEVAQDSDNGDGSFSVVTSKRTKIELSQSTPPSTSTSSVMSPMDWKKTTPDKLRTPKSKPLRSILMKASGKENKNVLSEKIILWASNKADTTSQQQEYLKKEHQLKVQLMKELHHHKMSLYTKESDERLLSQAKKAELELEILQLQKEQLLLGMK